MKPLQHLLIVPDGSRRHARREYLASLLRRSETDLERALEPLGPDIARGLFRRIRQYVDVGEDSTESGQTHTPGGDCLDVGAIRVPNEALTDSYRASGRVIDSMLRWVLVEQQARTLTIYGMQLRNLCRSDDEVLAFLEVETAYAAEWASDADLCARCSFRFVGDPEALMVERKRPALAATIDRYLEQVEGLTRAGVGSELHVNVLAPYDHTWEINQAVMNGEFRPELLPVREDVDLIFRSGSLGRSLTSGALPCQTAFSAHWQTTDYFPDCSVAHIQRAISETEAARGRSGL